MKYPNVTCPKCGQETLRLLWTTPECSGPCMLTCLGCSWEKNITHRWLLKRRHIKMQREKGRKERGEA